MAIQYPPQLGQILICNYDTGFRAPEMVKNRLVVVVSPRLPHRDGLCTVVPLSTTPPRSHVAYQCKVELIRSPPKPFEGQFKFAKADMLATVSYERLSMPFVGRTREGKRNYLKLIVEEEQLSKLRAAILSALGLGFLTKHLIENT